MRKMLKKLGIVIPSAVLTLLMAVGFSTPAFAYVELEVKEEPAQVIEEEEPTEEEKIPFSIAGNGEVEDNITDDSSKATARKKRSRQSCYRKPNLSRNRMSRSKSRNRTMES